MKIDYSRAQHDQRAGGGYAARPRIVVHRRVTRVPAVLAGPAGGGFTLTLSSGATLTLVPVDVPSSTVPDPVSNDAVV
jgi:hypothetical protein